MGGYDDGKPASIPGDSVFPAPFLRWLASSVASAGMGRVFLIIVSELFFAVQSAISLLPKVGSRLLGHRFAGYAQVHLIINGR